MIKAAIYDLDDLMVDSHPLHERATEPLLNKYGARLEDYPADLLPHFIGMRVKDVLKELKEYFNLPIDLDSLYKQRQEIFLDIVRKELKMRPGLKKSLQLFKEQNLPIAIASSGSTEYIDTVLDMFDLQSFFSAIVTGDDVTRGKPDPQVFQIACEKLGEKPEECVVLEDAHAGVTAAKAAGCKCIAIQSPSTPTQDLSKADLVLNSLEEITAETIKNLS